MLLQQIISYLSYLFTPRRHLDIRMAVGLTAKFVHLILNIQEFTIFQLHVRFNLDDFELILFTSCIIQLRNYVMNF